MKAIIRHFIIDSFCLFIISKIASGMIFEKGILTLLYAGVGLTVASILAKPVINLLLLPINLITFGLFRWVSSAVILYIVTLLIKDFEIAFFSFAGYKSIWIDLPSLYFEGVLAFIAFSFLISAISSFIYWVVK